jgi:imidazoleglycerol phosphate dehydratase HisB
MSRDEEQALTARLRDAMRQIGRQLGAMIHKEASAEIASARRRRFGDLASSLSDLRAAVVGPPFAPGSAGLVLTLPMDEALVQVTLDLIDRPSLQLRRLLPRQHFTIS